MLFALALLATSVVCARAEEVGTPVIPVGLDALRQWERWPVQRLGVRALMRSTYDRAGGNEGADASHFLYQLGDDRNVTLDVAGPGVLYFVRTNHWHGSPWHYEVDGVDHLIFETGTADPVHAKERLQRTVFLPEGLLPEPLAWTWSTTKGADLNWVPMPFEKSLRLAYSRTRYGTGYYILHQIDPTAPLSRPIKSWDGRTPPDADVLALMARAGSRLAPKAGSPEAEAIGLKELAGTIDLAAREVVQLAEIADVPSCVRLIELSAPRDQAISLGRARIRITWDRRDQASIDAPISLFFGSGTLYNRDNQEFLVKAFPAHIRFDSERVYLGCYWPMPFFRSASVELAAMGTEKVGPIDWRIGIAPNRERPSDVGYFHATYADHANPEPGHDLVILDTNSEEGGGPWSGHFVGMSWIFSDQAVLNTLEGDPRFFFDDSQTPQAQGTGTEEWGGGGDYWGGRTMTLPFAGHPVGAKDLRRAVSEEDRIESAYRFLLSDLMPFGHRALIRLEHGGENLSTEHYQSVAFWYGAPAPSLVLTDTIQIGDADDEKAHDYSSLDASAPYEFTSRYEWGPDRMDGREVYPEQTVRGRKTTGTSEFSLTLKRENWGVLLRRTLDYSFPNQRAEVYIADGAGKEPEGWRHAGTWYLAGSNTCVYSNPKEELGATQHVLQTSNRRLRDDEFIIPRELTRGRSQIRVRIQFTPVEIPLYPGHQLSELAWSELRYEARCWVLPEWAP